jgi:hypothetical protein
VHAESDPGVETTPFFCTTYRAGIFRTGVDKFFRQFIYLLHPGWHHAAPPFSAFLQF